jgi:hypothetical protein
MIVPFGPNGYNLANGQDILNPTISLIIDQASNIAGINDSDKVASDLGFVKHTPLTPEEQITSVRAMTPSASYGEGEAAERKKRDEGYRKTSKLKKFGHDIAVTDEFVAWLESGKQIDGADSSVKRELMKFGNDVEASLQALDKTKSILMTSVLGFGTSTKDFGPGSAGGDAKALFADDHPNGGFTLDNLYSTALDSTNLLAAINAMKGFKSENGELIDIPSTFTLVIPRALESTARALMNSVNNMAGMYSGTGSNSAMLNTFFFQNQKVEIVVADRLNQDSYNVLNFNGLSGTIGSSTCWYLMNKEGLTKAKAFQFWSLWDKKVRTWRDDSTDTNYVRVNMYGMADSFNAHQFVLRGQA